MKSSLYGAALILVLFTAATLSASEQDEKRNYSLKGENIIKEGQLLDSHYEATTRRMGELIKRYKLLTTKDIVTVPYQVEYSLGKDFIKMEKHSFERSAYDRKRILSVYKKSITIFTDGLQVRKIETSVYRKDYRTGNDNLVTLTDPTPTAGGTDDITITQVKNGKTIMKARKLKDFRNTTAYPVRNDLKRNFLIDHIGTFNEYLLLIGESYDKKNREHDSEVNGFLKTALKQ